MQQAWRTRLTAAKVGFDMGVPFNELNRAFDLGFRPLPHGDNCYLPSQLQEVGRLQANSQTNGHRSNQPTPSHGELADAIAAALNLLRAQQSGRSDSA